MAVGAAALPIVVVVGLVTFDYRLNDNLVFFLVQPKKFKHPIISELSVISTIERISFLILMRGLH